MPQNECVTLEKKEKNRKKIQWYKKHQGTGVVKMSPLGVIQTIEKQSYFHSFHP